MTDKFIPLADFRQRMPTVPAHLESPSGVLLDSLQRPLHDLRISVTDRCNFRCVYCMPKEVFDSHYQFLPHASLLTFEEITRLATIFVAHGVKKIRLTGGEPLLRKNLERLIAMLAELRTVDGQPLDLSLTTNGALLARKAQALKNAGLNRVTVSLDALDAQTFRKMNDVDFDVSEVLQGITAAHEAGLGPVKINMVVKKGWNEQEIVPMARYFQHTPHTLRFIEYMDVGASNGWQMQDVVPSAEVLAMLRAAGMNLQPLQAQYAAETAKRWQHVDDGGEVGAEIGFISSVTQSFCHDCTRLRLSTEGKLYTCLFASEGHDLRAALRGAQFNEQAISTIIAQIWRQRGDHYSELRTAQTTELHGGRKKIEMSYIGG